MTSVRSTASEHRAHLGSHEVWLVGWAMLCGLIVACTPVEAPPIPTATVAAVPPEQGATADAPPAPTTASTVPTLDPSAPVATVRRGTIDQAVTLAGRVVGRQELAIAAPETTLARRILVSTGDSVTEGQVLVELGETDQRQRFEAARGREQQAAIRAEQAQARVQERMQQVSDEADRLQRSTLSAELQVAQSTVLQARAGLQRAEAELAMLTARPAPDDVQAADQQVRAAEIMLARAEAERERVLGVASEAQVRKAENEVALAENGVRQAVEAAQKLAGEAEPLEVRSAQRTVQLAQLALLAAQRQPPEIATARALVLVTRNRGSQEREVARRLARQQVEAALVRQRLEIQRAEADLMDAVRALQAVTREPSNHDREVASHGIEAALENLAAAREHLAALQTVPSQEEVDAATLIVDGARAALEQARTHRAALDTGPPTSQLAATRAAVTTSRAALVAAEEQATDLTNRQRSLENELSAARSEVELLRGILTGAVNSLEEAARPDADPSIVEFAQAQVELAEARRDLPDDPDPMALVAPVAGTIASVGTGPGEEVGPDRPALTMIPTTDLVVQASLAPPDGSRVVQGMSARVRLGTEAGADLPATVDRIDESSNGRTAHLSVTWSPPLPAVGTEAQVIVPLQRQDVVLLVPMRAIRLDGGRRFVDVVNGTTVERVEVTTGRASGADVEISGVQEGQRVLLGP